EILIFACAPVFQRTAPYYRSIEHRVRQRRCDHRKSMAIERKPMFLANSLAAHGVRQRCGARFSNRGKLLWARMGSVLLVVLSAVACTNPKPQATQRLNLLLLAVDGLRVDRLGVYGNERDVSPTIDRLAASGVRFAHAV